MKLFIRQVLSRSSATLAGMTDKAAVRGDALAGRSSDAFHARATGKSVVKVWKERGRAFPVVTQDVFLQKLTYIHNNPVRAGLVERPEEWKFSSAAWFSNGQGLLAIENVQ